MRHYKGARRVLLSELEGDEIGSPRLVGCMLTHGGEDGCGGAGAIDALDGASNHHLQDSIHIIVT